MSKTAKISVSDDSKDAAAAHKPASPPLLQIEALTKSYQQGGRTLDVLREVDLAINAGEMVGLVGPSGSGKSTLLHLIGLLDRPTSGQIMIEGKDMSAVSEKERTITRRQKIGFIYQFHHLQPEFSALENVMIPQMIAGVSKTAAKDTSLKLLERLGLKDRANHRPAELSGGEQQRVAIVRALANNPLLLLADEPTGNLDHETGDHVFELFIESVRDAGIGALVATHNIDLADRMDRVLEVKNGGLSIF